MPDTIPTYPRKYWWLVLVVVPLALAAIALVPQLTRPSAPASPGSISVHGDNHGVVNIDSSVNMTVINNISTISEEYRKLLGHDLDKDLEAKISQALDAARANDEARSVPLFEQVAAKAPVPTILNHLGVAYAKAHRNEEAIKTLTLALAKAPDDQRIRQNLSLARASAAIPPPRTQHAGIRVSKSGAGSVIVIEKLHANYSALSEFHVTPPGANPAHYTIKYRIKGDEPVLVEAGKYAILAPTENQGVFVLVPDLDVPDGTRVTIEPDALVGGISVRPPNNDKFPAITDLTFIDHAHGSRLIRQYTKDVGAILPIAPGTYDVLCSVKSGQHFELLRGVDVKAQETMVVDAGAEMAAILVKPPNIPGVTVQEVYALLAGTDTVIASTKSFGEPMMLFAGDTYDIALQQAAGLTRIKTKVSPIRGRVLDVP